MVSAYALLDTFTLCDAGFLLIDQKPGDRDPIIRNEAYAVTGQLVSDVKAGKLPAKKPENTLKKILHRLNGDCVSVDYCESYPKVTVTRIDEYKEANSSWIVTREDLINWANAKGLKPVFLFGQKITSINKPAALSESQMHKKEFQKNAKAMWEKNLNLTRTEIIESPEMLFYKNNYRGKHTLRNWIKEVDPIPNRPAGRPKKYPPA